MNYYIELERRGISATWQDNRPVFARADGQPMLPADKAFIVQHKQEILEDLRSAPEFIVDGKPMKFEYKTLLRQGYCLSCGEKVELTVWQDDDRFAHYRCEACGQVGWGQISWEKAE